MHSLHWMIVDYTLLHLYYSASLKESYLVNMYINYEIEPGDEITFLPSLSSVYLLDILPHAGNNEMKVE